MKRFLSLISLVLVAFSVASPALADSTPAKRNLERGRDATRGRPSMNGAMFPQSAFDNAWKAWGLKEKPANFAAMLRERYGLHAAPYGNDGLPMGLHSAGSFFGKGVGGDCLLCHAGAVAGQTVIGLGNASLDMQTLFEEVNAVFPIKLSNVRGTIEATSVVTFFMEFRDADLNFKTPGKIQMKEELCEDVPAWWLMKRKKTMYHTGAGHARSVRTMMPFALTPLNSGEDVKKLEPTFADIQAYLLSLEAPRYPFAIDKNLAARGHELFKEHCVKCHGTHGPDGRYPSKVIPLKVIGTDPRLAEGLGAAAEAHYLKSWFAQEKDADGKPFPIQTIRGYQAPPLDGVWATAPYFHNGSVPTLYHVLNSKARPRIFTRSYRTEKEDYDSDKVGWKVTVLDRAADPKLSVLERRKIYDTTQTGRGNGGHTFGDQLTDEQRRAVIEYLKSL